jgi:hypothetical protein
MEMEAANPPERVFLAICPSEHVVAQELHGKHQDHTPGRQILYACVSICACVHVH